MRLAVFLLLAGCAYVEATTVPYVGVPKYEPVDPATVQVLAARPRAAAGRHREALARGSGEVGRERGLRGARPAAAWAGTRNRRHRHTLPEIEGYLVL